MILAKPFNRLPFALTSALVVLVALAPTLIANEDELPSAESLMDRHVEASGGKEAHLEIKSRKLTGKFEVDVAGHKFDAQLTELSGPQKYHQLLEGTNFSMVRASNGTDAWEWRPQNLHGEESTRVYEGQEKATAVALANFYRNVNWRKNFSKLETVSVDEVDGRPVYEVKLVDKSGEESSRFFDQETGLLVKVERMVESGHFGNFKAEVFMTNYKEVDGVQLPMKVTQKLNISGSEPGYQIYTYDSVEHNVELPNKLFVKPGQHN